MRLEDRHKGRTMHRSINPTRRSFIGIMGAATLGSLLAPRTLRGQDRPRRAQPFAPAIGVCTSAGHAGTLRQAGADYIEEGVRRLLIPDQPDAAFAAKLEAAKACGLPIRAANGFLPGSLKCVGPEADHEGVLAFAETAFRRANRVGIRTIVFGSSGARTIPEGFDRRKAELQFVALLGKMAVIAEREGVFVAVEPLNRGETNFINTVEEGAELVSCVQHPNVGLTADIFHMLRESEPAGHIRRAGAFVRHVHIAEKRTRTPPGVDGDDFTPYLRALKDIKYTGPISIECRWSDLGQQLPVAVRTLKEQLAGLS
jgi:sugar phosphate isomerase/epimerase